MLKFLFVFVSILSCLLLNPIFISAQASKINQKSPDFPAFFDRHSKEKDFENEFERLRHSMSKSLDSTDQILDSQIYKNIIDSVSDNGSQLKLKDGPTIDINWWYQSYAKGWKKEDQLYITFDFYHQQIMLEHAVLKEIAWASPAVVLSKSSSIPTIQSIRNESNKSDAYSKITLSNGYVFRAVLDTDLTEWKAKDRIIIFANSEETYQLWNVDRSVIKTCILIGNHNVKAPGSIEINDVLGLEDRLNKKVLQQPEATQAIATALLNYVAGFTGKGRPIAVFLFLGPTGVGKTELAKVLTEEIYNDPTKMLRFDMSHFTESHSISRLIGSPPGYVNHEEGGQLTEPLIGNGQQIILLDELEKAHPQVLKTFLPVFDEGFILDSKNNRIDCSEVIFIMTSNLCGPQIAEFYNLGIPEEEILAAIETTLMETLSPELYNRVEPVLFRPLAKETMHALVDLMLKQLKNRLLLEKEITILIDDSLKHFLVEKGYHPLLGARPLKKLIEKRVVGQLAYYIIKNRLPVGAVLTLYYDDQSDLVIIE